MHVHSMDFRSLADIPFHLENYDAIFNQLWGIFYQSDTNAKHISSLLDFILLRKDVDLSMISLDGVDAYFFEFIIYFVANSRIEEGCVFLNQFRRNVHASKRLDFLARLSTDWSLIQTINYLAHSSVFPSKVSAVVATFRNEGISILEWVAFYRSIGVDSIFIYTNDNDDGSDLLLEVLAQVGIITLISNSIEFQNQDLALGKAYNHALSSLPELWEHEWLLFVDADEFVVLKQHECSIPIFLQHVKKHFAEKPISGICLNWKWFGSEGELRRKPGLLLERFIYAHPNSHVKTLARLREVTGLRTTHLPRLIHGGVLADSSFAIIDNPMNDIGPIYQYGQINHYWNKSFEEFVGKTIRSSHRLDFPYFFRWGNESRGDADPVPSPLIQLVRNEVASLSAIPGIRAATDLIERRFVEILRSFDDQHGLECVYDASRRSSQQ